MRSLLLALAGSALALTFGASSLLSAAVAVPPPYVRDSRASDILVHSAWGRQNGVTAADCTGIGPARKAAALRQHASFRCRVALSGEPGVVAAKALGPEWLRVASILEGKLKPDGGIGPIPQGRPKLESFWAGSALEDTAWAGKNHIETAFCFGVGRFQAIGRDGYLFSAYSCSTVDTAGRRAAQVLVTATGSDSVRVVRTLAR